jgi:hypothetical protein
MSSNIQGVCNQVESFISKRALVESYVNDFKQKSLRKDSDRLTGGMLQ